MRAHTSPALAIAYALRSAPSCADRLPLLERTAADGDLRTVAILSALADGQRTGCGVRNLQRCPAVCPAEAAEMRKTVEAMRAGRREIMPFRWGKFLCAINALAPSSVDRFLRRYA